MNTEDEFDEVRVVTAQDRVLSTTDIVASGATLQRQQTKYVTAIAVQRPRRLNDVLMRVKAEVELDPEGAFYGWDVGRGDKKKHVEGPTIGLCMSIARNYGNAAVDVQIEETPGYYLFTPVFLDLETGFTFSRAFRQRKSQNIGMSDKDRAEDITFQIGQSKAIRNVIKSSVPQAIIDNAIDHAKRCAADRLTPEKIDKMKLDAIQSFQRDYGVTIEQLGAYMGDPDPVKWSVDKVVALRTVYRSLKSGDLSVKDVFPENEKKPEPVPQKVAHTSNPAPVETAIPEPVIPEDELQKSLGF